RGGGRAGNERHGAPRAGGAAGRRIRFVFVPASFSPPGEPGLVEAPRPRRKAAGPGVQRGPAGGADDRSVRDAAGLGGRARFPKRGGTCTLEAGIFFVRGGTPTRRNEGRGRNQKVA